MEHVEPEAQESLCSREEEEGRGSCGLVQLERPILLLIGGPTRPQRDLREEGTNRNLAETGGLQRKKREKWSERVARRESVSQRDLQREPNRQEPIQRLRTQGQSLA